MSASGASWPAPSLYTDDLVDAKLAAHFPVSRDEAAQVLARLDQSYLSTKEASRRNGVKLGCIFLAGPNVDHLAELVRMGSDDERDPMWRVGHDLEAFAAWLDKPSMASEEWSAEKEESYARAMSGGLGPEERKAQFEAMMERLRQDQEDWRSGKIRLKPAPRVGFWSKLLGKR